MATRSSRRHRSRCRDRRGRDGPRNFVTEVNFATLPGQTQFAPPPDFVYDPDAFWLPRLNGSGTVADLWVAMSLNSSLLDDVRDLVVGMNEMSGAEFASAFENHQEWTGASSIDPTSRGPYVDARHLAVVHALYGLDDSLPINQLNPNMIAGPRTEAIYRTIIESFEVRFVFQALIGQLVNGVSWADVTASWLMPFSEIAFDAKTDTISVDFNQLVRDVVDQAPADGTASFYYERAFTLVKALRLDLFNNDDTALATSFSFASTQAGMPAPTLHSLLAELGYGFSTRASRPASSSPPPPERWSSWAARRRAQAGPQTR